eukprot:2009641-Rhodomonas_salina.1
MQTDNVEYTNMVSQENHFSVFNTVTTTTTTTMTSSCFCASNMVAKLSEGESNDSGSKVGVCSIGQCGVCNQAVDANEPKGLDDGGVYYHHPCWLIRFGDWSE